MISQLVINISEDQLFSHFLNLLDYYYVILIWQVKTSLPLVFLCCRCKLVYVYWKDNYWYCSLQKFTAAVKNIIWCIHVAFLTLPVPQGVLSAQIYETDFQLECEDLMYSNISISPFTSCSLWPVYTDNIASHLLNFYGFWFDCRLS